MTAIRQMRGGFGDSAFADNAFASKSSNFEIITFATLSNTLNNLTSVIVTESTTGLGGFMNQLFYQKTIIIKVLDFGTQVLKQVQAVCTAT